MTVASCPAPGVASSRKVRPGHVEVVELYFDGNIESLGGNFGFDPVNHAVAVDTGAIREVRTKSIAHTLSFPYGLPGIH